MRLALCLHACQLLLGFVSPPIQRRGLVNWSRTLPPTLQIQELSRRTKRRKRGLAKAERAKEFDTARILGHADAASLSQRKAPFRYLCVLDVEATCEMYSNHYVHEIIEFPVVVVDLHDKKVVGEFHTYVRPTVNKTLSEFCTKLTGITQDRVDSAPTLKEVLALFEQWRLQAFLVHTPERQEFAFATDGPWDLQFFLHGECERKGIRKAAYFDKWVNIKALFSDFYRCRTCKIHKMLEIQNMRFEVRVTANLFRQAHIVRRCVDPG